MDITFTQYLMPDGRTKQVMIDRPDDIAKQAQALVTSGLSLEIELLSTDIVSLAVEDHENDETVAIELVENGPGVLDAVDRLIVGAFGRMDARFNAEEERTDV